MSDDLSTAPPVVVVGGGIGGLACARALTLAGHRVRVLERTTTPHDGGAGLHVWANGTAALDRLGVLDRVLEVAPRQRVCSFVAHDGRALGAWNVARLEADLGYPTIAVERRVLHRALRESLPEDVLAQGRTVDRVRETADGAAVHLTDGAVVAAAFVVGADGVRSRVRQALPGARPVRRHGYVGWRGQSRTGALAPGTFTAVFGPGIRLTYYDVAPGLVHWMAVVEADDALARPAEPAVVLAALRVRYAGWGATVEHLLAGADPEHLLRHEVLDRDPESRWGAGHVTLLGDAAHPITFNVGQGASQALEDALELASLVPVSTAPGEVPSRLREYEEVRRRRTTPLQRTARWIGRLGRLSSPPGVLLRTAVMRTGWDRVAWSGVQADAAYAVERFAAAPPLLPVPGSGPPAVLVTPSRPVAVKESPR